MVRPPQLKIERTPVADATCTVSVRGELDLATTPTVEDEVNSALAEGADTVDIDLADLTFIDSTGLRMFFKLNEQAVAQGWRLVLRNPSHQVQTILKITGSGDELPITQEAQS
jgi:anti-anti-sigma factor